MLPTSEIIKKLKSAGALSDQVPNMGYVSTGSYALNDVISGDYTKGVPIGHITQIKGNSSTAKTVFLTHILKEAQKAGYYAILDDSENAYSPAFAKSLGINPKKLIYTASQCIEDAFSNAENIISTIREEDKDTPIIYGLDSLAVLPVRKELEADNYDQSPVDGALRAKVTGGCLRKIHSKIRKHKCALIVINQLREKIGIMYGDNETTAAGGRALEYYISVDLHTKSNKTSDVMRNEDKEAVGIIGTIRNKKNKVSMPFKECGFELYFNKGLTECYGLVESLIKKGYITIPTKGWYQVLDTKFRKKDFVELINNKELSDFDEIRKLVGIN